MSDSKTELSYEDSDDFAALMNELIPKVERNLEDSDVPAETRFACKNAELNVRVNDGDIMALAHFETKDGTVRVVPVPDSAQGMQVVRVMELILIEEKPKYVFFAYVSDSDEIILLFMTEERFWQLSAPILGMNSVGRWCVKDVHIPADSDERREDVLNSVIHGRKEGEPNANGMGDCLPDPTWEHINKREADVKQGNLPEPEKIRPLKPGDNIDEEFLEQLRNVENDTDANNEGL